MLAIARLLEQVGHRTYLPQRDGLERLLLRLAGSPLARLSSSARQLADRAIFALDVFHLVERCTCLVFNMNGRVPDEGAAAEAAIAFSLGKPVILYKQDARSPFDGRDNSMLLGLSAVAPVGTLGEIPAALETACAGLAATAAPAVLPRAVSRALEQGERIDRWLGRLPNRPSVDRDTAVLLRELELVLGESGG